MGSIPELQAIAEQYNVKRKAAPSKDAASRAAPADIAADKAAGPMPSAKAQGGVRPLHASRMPLIWPALFTAAACAQLALYSYVNLSDHAGASSWCLHRDGLI